MAIHLKCVAVLFRLFPEGNTTLSTIKAYKGYQSCHRVLWINPAANITFWDIPLETAVIQTINPRIKALRYQGCHKKAIQSVCDNWDYTGEKIHVPCNSPQRGSLYAPLTVTRPKCLVLFNLISYIFPWSKIQILLRAVSEGTWLAALPSHTGKTRFGA